MGVHVKYITDFNVEIIIAIKYKDNFINERLGIGGFFSNPEHCKSIFTRRWIEPRNVRSKNYGLILFKSNELWLNYIKNNTDDILSSQGEIIKKRFYTTMMDSIN